MSGWWDEHRSTAIRWGGVAALLLFAGTLLGRSIWANDGVEQAPPPVHVQGMRALSGHSIKVEHEDGEDDRIICAGIRSPYPDEPLHAEARNRSAELIVGRELRLRFDEQERDRTERLLAYVFADDVFVNETLVREGLAFVRLTSATRRFADRLLAAQQQARAERKGIWAHVGPSDEAGYPADPKYGAFYRPHCETAVAIKAQRRVEFANKNAAFDQGFAPCNKCDP